MNKKVFLRILLLVLSFIIFACEEPTEPDVWLSGFWKGRVENLILTFSITEWNQKLDGMVIVSDGKYGNMYKVTGKKSHRDVEMAIELDKGDEILYQGHAQDDNTIVGKLYGVNYLGVSLILKRQ